MNIMQKITLKSLAKNKTRTIVTIIGVILSAAMITAVTSFASSIQNYILKYAIAENGNWHARIDIDSLENFDDIVDDNRISKVAITNGVGYSPLIGGTNEYKPYLYIMELDKQAFRSLPIRLTKGRLPETPDEVLIANHILDNGGVEYKLGQSIELEVGNRTIDGYNLSQLNPFNHEKDGQGELFEPTSKRSFKVVGFYDRFPFLVEGFSAPGYSILTCLDEAAFKENLQNNANLNNKDISLYVNLRKAKEVYDLEADLVGQYNIVNYSYNSRVLNAQGISHITGFNSVVTGLAIIILLLIMVGSISLIHNAFSISISERKKQFGLLSSVGATKKQLVNSIVFEAFFIGSIGIPLGIGSGILGIGVTLYFLRDNFIRMFGESIPVEPTLHVSIPSVIAAFIISFITILISAYLPAIKAKKTSTLDAIRQSSDIKLTSKKVKTSKLTRKLFGIEGDLALKNLKRNKKRYRSTVLSLFLSVLLFISASAFSMYLTDSVSNVYDDYNYDIAYHLYNTEELTTEHKDVFNKINNLDSITDGTIIRNGFALTYIKKDLVNESYYNDQVKYEYIEDGQDLDITTSIYTLDHKSFENYVKDLNLDLDKYQDPKNLTAIAIDKQHFFDNNEQRYKNTSILRDHKETSFIVSTYYGERENFEVTLQVGDFVDRSPLGVDKAAYYNRMILIFDEQVIQEAILKYPESNIKELHWSDMYSMYFLSNNPTSSVTEIDKILSDVALDNGAIENIDDQVKEYRNIITIINVFAYGFIVLMSLITIANVFNTITTNINLRRREFAMLKSVGMTSKGFNKMLNFECLFYGIKALLYGLPTSIFVTYMIYLVITQGVTTSFYLPIESIIISIICVFLVVFISMMYSMRKVRQENILDALKNENL
ncbi:MAG: ABC transporter permease [Clostridiales bacterium]|nr:ABC transporter permease [Clostridiales bacterium]